ncbi:MAG: PadR family transcriptional regulator [Candidatus Hodarchaeota archaeon]
MIKRVKEFGPGLLSDEKNRAYAENFESELLRGISTLIILRIIGEKGDEGAYGYQILKDLEDRTSGMLLLEEGTLYPMLRKLEKDEVLTSERRTPEGQGRERKYYMLSTKGKNIHALMAGFFSRLIESVGPLLDIQVILDESYTYCPNCTNQIFTIKGADLPVQCSSCGFTMTQQQIQGDD